jgi:hypothetical protein
MPHPLHLLGTSIVSLLVVATAVTAVVYGREPAPPTIVIVPVQPQLRMLSWGYPAYCYGYNWRYSSIDLRPWCGD